MIKIINDDCLVALRNIEDNSIDSVVTDPPYGISFMNKHWDYDVPKVEVWKEVFRVLKPGGHILCACGTRTQHRMAVNIEDAGFEIRNVVAWIYGSGFPKSLNIGKAIDELQGNKRDSIGVVSGMGKQNPEWNGTARGRRENSFKPEYEATKGNSEYEGWGTALKPAMELWTLARKPLSEKTVATNVLKWGTGGINIDGCRVEYTGDVDPRTFGGSWKTDKIATSIYEGGYRGENQTVSPQGRFPANVIHDGSDEVLNAFPDAKGQCGDLIGHDHNIVSPNDIFGVMPPRYDAIKRVDDSKSASRFFYCAKASKSERNKGTDGLGLEKELGHNRFDRCSLCGGFILQNQDRPSACKCEVPERENNSLKGNFHPTVKPISLMRYLCRMITPPKGTILDPYMGSGSTGIGAKVEGFNFIGIEREADYCKIAQARTDAWEEELPPKPEIIQQKLF